MNDDELRKLASYVVDAFVMRLSTGVGIEELIRGSQDELTEEQKKAMEEDAAVLEWFNKYEEPDG